MRFGGKPPPSEIYELAERLQRRTCGSICKVQTHAKRQTPNAIRNKISAATKMKMVADFWT
jgi:hypothetical protein